MCNKKINQSVDNNFLLAFYRIINKNKVFVQYERENIVFRGTANLMASRTGWLAGLALPSHRRLN